MPIESTVLLLGIGFVGGGWNAVAGGATLFTFPALMAVGLPPIVANATNYLALLPSNVAALPAYRQELKGIGVALLPLLVVSGLGATAGSLLLMNSDPEVFEQLIPFLIFLATLLFASGDWVRRKVLSLASGRTGGQISYALLLVSSIYGGYFGAGLGIILLAIAQLMGFSSFHVANGVKNLLASSFTLISVVIFGIGGLIAWPEALTMMVASTLGGYWGGRFSKCVSERYLRFAVICFGLILSIVYGYRSLGS